MTVRLALILFTVSTWAATVAALAVTHVKL